MRRLLLVAGPLLFTLLGLFAPMPGPAAWTAGIAAWMALWWITEVTNPAVTALLPLVLFPVSGVMPIRTASAEFGSDIIFLFIAGFFFGKAIERWGLHRRIALQLVLSLGAGPRGILLGFMVATAFVSMWISNTATAVMMTPVAIAVAGRQHSVHSRQPSADNAPTTNFNKALLLGVGYACSIGGMATIVGTPTNGIFLTFVQQKMGATVTFWQWFVFGAPFSAALLLACWGLLLWLFPLGKGGSPHEYTTAGSRGDVEEDPTPAGKTAAREAATGAGARWVEPLRAELGALGPLSAPELRLLIVFGTVILGWVTGSLLWYKWFGNGIGDSVVAVGGAIALFLVPAGRGDGDGATPLLDWAHAVRIPWGIVLFFGGGLALAKGFEVSGLAAWMGGKMSALQMLPTVVILLTVFAVVVVLSELASNIATASMMMPVLSALAVSLGMEPMGLLFGAALASSIGFGLPIATAPNTIVYGSGYLTTRDMARAGFLLDAVAIALLLAFVYLVPM